MSIKEQMGTMLDKISGRFDGYELFYLKEKENKIEARDGEICTVEIREEEGYALRAVKDARPVFVYTYDRNDPANRLIANVEALLPVVEKDEGHMFPGPYAVYPTQTLYDKPGIAVSDDEKKSLLLAMEEAIRSYDKRIATVRNCEFQQLEMEVVLENSKGLRVSGQKTLFFYSAMAVAKEGDDEVSWYDWCWSHDLASIDGKRMGIAIADKTVSMLSAKQIATGTYEGVLAPRAASELLGILSESFLAENLFKNKTQLKGKEGTNCFAGAVTIIDSGMAGVNAFSFDGEGVPSADNTVVDRGVFRTFLYDSYFAKKFGMASTGSSVRNSLKTPPKCGPRGMSIGSGSRDIAKSITNGIMIEELMGTHTANAVTGDFSVGCLGYIVQNGAREPFQGVMLSGNVFDLFKNTIETGNDPIFYGAFGSPSLYVEGLKISGT